MAKRKIERAQNGNWVCPHCGSDQTFQNSNFTFTTDFVQLYPCWCEACNMPFHIMMKDGRVVDESEF